MTTETVRVPTVDPGYVRQRAASLVARGRERVEVLRAAPDPARATTFHEGGATVHVRPCVSALAVLDAYERLPEGDYLIVLTDRDRHDLGDSVLLRARGRDVHVVDPWSEVPALFGARTADRELRSLGTWAADALVAYQPADGWPRVTSDTVTARHALSNLLARLLQQRLPSSLDEVSIAVRLDERDGRLAWQATDADLRQRLTAWASDTLGPAAHHALTVAAQRQVPVAAVGLAMDVLWPAEAEGVTVTEEQVAARVRAERILGGEPIRAEDARRLADVARVVTLRREAESDPELGRVLEAAEEVLASTGWAAGAERSDILRAGLRARLRHLASVLHAGLEDPTAVTGVETALDEVLEHRLARPTDREVVAARMAVRLLRWLAHPTGARADLPSTLTAALWQQVDDGGWVDRAVAPVWTGSADPEIGTVYRALLERVAALRRTRDEVAARQLADATAADAALTGVTPLETLRERVLARLTSAHDRVLVVVVDGMSTAVASEVVESATGRGWTELLPPSAEHRSGRRAAALAVLPSMTTYSRTSLFAGALCTGTQDVEERRWREELHAPVFHKDDLSAGAGALLPDDLLAAINAPGLVGVVLNTVDDALFKADPGGTSWSDEMIRHLRPLLDAAYLADRVVVLTSDHGHVIERGSRLHSVPGGAARWRPADSGPVQDGEVLVEGRRVLAGEGTAVLAWTEDLRYSNRAAGYHGGASLAEITVPLIVLARGADADVAGWRPGPPQAPAWWNDPAAARPEPVAGGRRARRSSAANAVDGGTPVTRLSHKPSGTAAPEGQGTLGFDVEPPPAPMPDTDRGLVAGVLDSPTYREQRARGGRHALDDAVVRALLDALVARDGRAHRDTLATAAGITTVEITGMLAALRRLLNVEGYAVVREDVDGTTVVLDLGALRQQFELED